MKTIESKATKKKKNNHDPYAEYADYVDSIYPEWYVAILTSRTHVFMKKEARKPSLVTLSGKLCQTKDKFVYVDIPNEVINGLFELIDDPNKTKPPYNNKKYNGVGAHISVMYADEVVEKNLNVKEIGQQIEFTLGDVMTVEPEGWDGMERVWFVTAKSEQLEDLRTKYDLTRRLNGHDYHITIAVRKK